ncbi:MAG TPA: microviridin/marinostatin family tricyclic proteinase inhibitor [Pyrinomonadaceae bacterium]|jgi:hypothetical protein
MKRHKRLDAESNAQAEERSDLPFFARFLESQDDADAEIRNSRRVGKMATSTRSSGAKSKAKSGGKASSKATKKSRGTAGPKRPLMTLKYPSDRDEVDFYPYFVTAETTIAATGNRNQTLKFPSDGDEEAYAGLYVNRQDIPAGNVKRLKDARIRITRKAADSDES